MANKYTAFAGRKLTGLVICVVGMVGTALGTLGMCAAEMLDASFATNITLTVVGGIGTLYATFVGGNYGEHVAKRKYSNGHVATQEERPKAAVAAAPPSALSPTDPRPP
jgi:hypothetical protein